MMSPALDLVVPVYNEERSLEERLRRLHAHLAETFPYGFRITVADNASTDATLPVAERLARELAEVRAVHLPVTGRGNALRTVWLASDAPVLAYIDAALPVDLDALGRLLAPVLAGEADLAAGIRVARAAESRRGQARAAASRAYNALLRAVFSARVRDAQCGLKAIRADAARVLLPHATDPGWFFDTELMVLADRCGLVCREVPVVWREPVAEVDLVRTAVADARGVVRLARRIASGRIPVGALRRELGGLRRQPC